MLTNVDENLLLFSLEFAEQKEYWTGKLAGDFWQALHWKSNGRINKASAAPAAQKHKESIDIFIPDEVNNQVLKLSKNSNLSIYLIVLTVIKILIFRYCGRKDSIVMSPVYKPKMSEKTLNDRVLIRSDFYEDITFKELLLRVRQFTLEAYDNQDYPLDKLLEYLSDETGKEYNACTGAALCCLRDIHHEEILEKAGYSIAFAFLREDSRLKGKIHYEPLLYNRYVIEQMTRHFINILETAARDIHVPVSKISFLSDSQREQVLIHFNGTGMDYPLEKPLGQIFAEQVLKSPDRIAAAADAIGSPGTARLTYKQLNGKANLLAARLREKGVGADTIVGLMMERSLEMIVGIWGILKAGGGYMPIDLDYPQTRKKIMLLDSRAPILITGKKISEKAGELLAGFDKGHVLFFDYHDAAPGQPVDNPPIINRPGDLAYVIYTSGTTGKPKGVMIRHRNVNNLVSGLNERVYSQYRPPLRVALVSPFTFDASVKQIFAALLLGHILCIVPEEVRVDALYLLAYYREQTIDISDGTPAHLSMLIEIMEENTPKFPVKHFLIGGEALTGKVVEGFFSKVKTRGLKITNVYGPTECCVDAASYELTDTNEDSPASLTVVPIGKPMPNFVVYIFDKVGQPQPVGAAGELCLGGDSVGRGYLNRTELTARKFFTLSPDFFRTYRTYITQRIYKTGDLCQWLPDGNIEFLGRIDFQVKVRGFRIEPEEIENCLLKMNHIKTAVVTARNDKNSDIYLCAYIVTRNQVTVARVREYLSDQLPDYMIPAYFVQLDALPVTPYGKIDRHALPAPEVGKGEEYNPPRNHMEEKLAAIWAEVLGIPGNIIGIDHNFFELGGHSLKATILASRIHKEFNVKFPLVEIFRAPNIRSLVKHIQSSEQIQYTSITPVEQKEYYRLSSAQKRLYILKQMDLNSTAYNLPIAIPLRLHGETGIKKLEKTFIRLIKRHESLRTSFHRVNSEPVQRVHAEVDFKIEYYPSPGTENIQQDFVRSFDLSRAPLFRVGLAKLREQKHLLMIDMHHIISDGISLEILERDFTRLYSGEELPGLKLHYKDYAQWQNTREKETGIKQQEAYWLKEFASDVPVLDLPFDYQRFENTGFEAGTLNFDIPAGDTRGLRALAKEKGATLYMVVMTVFYVLLFKLTNQEDIVVGSPIAGRGHMDLEQIIGMFVNTLALRNFPRGEKTFRGFLEEVKKRTLEAFANQDYPFETLVEKSAKSRAAARNPLFDVIFSLQNTNENSLETTEENMDLPPAAAGPEVQQQWFEPGISKFDMIWVGLDLGDHISCAIEYNKSLCKPETMKRYIDYFMEIVTAVVETSGIQLKDIRISHKLLKPGAAILHEDSGDFGF